MIKTYSDLRRIDSIMERFNYLKLGGVVARATFGAERYLNQEFYRSREWRLARRDVIARDLGCDLGVPGYEIHDRVYVHHMNPLSIADIDEGNPDMLNPEFLISVTFDTHNAIHYGDDRLLKRRELVERRPGDTKLW